MQDHAIALSPYEFLRYPALVLFSLAFVFEILLVIRMFGPTGSVKGYMKAWFIFGFGLVSVTNFYAALEVSENAYLSAAVITKMMYCGTVLHLSFIAYVFHLPIWRRRDQEMKTRNESSSDNG